jgi:hypothetical protein
MNKKQSSHTGDPNLDRGFLQLWTDLYTGVENQLSENLLIELAHMAGYGYCAADLVALARSAHQLKGK